MIEYDDDGDVAYIERVMRTLLPLSVGKELDVIRLEWVSDGVETPEGKTTCQLCGKKEIVRNFTIENGLTHHKLVVGSVCITRFDCGVRDENGVVVYGEEAKQCLDRRIRCRKSKQERQCEYDVAVRMSENGGEAAWFNLRQALSDSDHNITPKLQWRVAIPILKDAKEHGLGAKGLGFGLDLHQFQEGCAMISQQDFDLLTQLMTAKQVEKFSSIRGECERQKEAARVLKETQDAAEKERKRLWSAGLAEFLKAEVELEIEEGRRHREEKMLRDARIQALKASVGEWV